MNVTGKLDLDGLLKEWPAPATRDDAAWEARADQIVGACVSRRSEDAAALAALLGAPDLAPEPGEEDAESTSRAVHAVGDQTKMSQESDQGGAAKPEAGRTTNRPSHPAERKRQSLKEIAERASQSSRNSVVPGASASSLSTPLPSGRGSMPPGRGSMPPSRGSMPPSRGSMPPARGSMPPSRSSAPPGRAVETDEDDSGIIDLHRASAAAAPAPKATDEKAKPSAVAAVEDAARPAAVAAKAPKVAAAAPPPAKKGSTGVIAGAAIAALGLAAAFTIMQRPKETAAPTTAAAPAVAEPVAAQPEAKPAETPPPVAAATATPTATEAPAGDTKAAEPSKVAASTGGPSAAATAAAPAAVAANDAKVEPAKPAASAAPAGKPGDLSSAMQAAVGDNGAAATAVESEAPEPAAGKLSNKSIPEQPPQGAVAAAIGGVMGSAKACVAGADDVSRAVITFSSSGAVSNVNVTGWAASNGQAACIKSALKGANVGPFSKSSYTFPVTIRP